jgi:hypothetical protein
MPEVEGELGTEGYAGAEDATGEDLPEVVDEGSRHGRSQTGCSGLYAPRTGV